MPHLALRRFFDTLEEGACVTVPVPYTLYRLFLLLIMFLLCLWLGLQEVGPYPGHTGQAGQPKYSSSPQGSPSNIREAFFTLVLL